MSWKYVLKKLQDTHIIYNLLFSLVFVLAMACVAATAAGFSGRPVEVFEKLKFGFALGFMAETEPEPLTPVEW